MDNSPWVKGYSMCLSLLCPVPSTEVQGLQDCTESHLHEHPLFRIEQTPLIQTGPITFCLTEFRLQSSSGLSVSICGWLREQEMESDTWAQLHHFQATLRPGS